MSILADIINRMNEATTLVPEPFLCPVFPFGVEPVIATGFNYTKAEIAIHGVEKHGAIDFDVPRGTPILAPADGYAMCTYGESLVVDDDGRPRLLSEAKAHKGNPRNLELRIPMRSGPWPIFFGSYVIQIWNGRGRYTQYAHVDGVADGIPFHASVPELDDDKKPTGNLGHSPKLRLPVKELRRPANSRRVTQGECIGWTGMTGCGWGERCFDSATFDKHGKPDFRTADYTYYTSPHLHFMVFGRRAPRTRTPRLYDPFGLYGDITTGYTSPTLVWQRASKKAKHHSLWL